MTLVEVCLEDVGGAAVAAAAGAEAVEVCAGLADGGTTPTLGFVLHCVATRRTSSTGSSCAPGPATSCTRPPRWT